MSKLSLKIFTIVSVFSLLIGGLINVSAKQNTNEFVILHTNDVHGQIDAKLNELAYLKAYKDYTNAQFLFDAGDSSQGLPLSNITKGASLASIYNLIGFDAATLGNHEFDFSRDAVLGKDPGFFTAAQFPIIASNIYFDQDAKANETIGSSVFDTNLIINKAINGNDISMSVFGLVTPETKFKADPRNSEGMEFRNPLESIKKELEDSKHDDSDYIVILAHLGIDKETKKEWRGDYLASELADDPELSNRKIIIIDGHSHSEEKDGKRFGNNVLYGQTGGKLGSIGEMRINLDDFSKSILKTVTLKDGYNISDNFKDIAPDSNVIDLIKEVAKEFEDLTGFTVLENLDFNLNGDREYARRRETNLGNLIADSMYEYANEVFKGTDLAVVNGGGIRDSIKAGRVLYKDLLTVLPFGNRVVQIDVTGKQIYEMFEHSLGSNTNTSELDDNGLETLESSAALLHVSNSVKLRFDPRIPKGSRVQSILINDLELDLTKVYKLATIEFLAIGGDGYTMLGGARDEGANDVDVLKDYISRSDIDLSVYKDDKVKRVLSIANFEKIAFDSLSKVLLESSLYNNDDLKYSEESYLNLVKAQNIVSDILRKLDVLDNQVSDITYEEYEVALKNLSSAINNLELRTDKSPTEVEDKEDHQDKEDSKREDVDTGVNDDSKLYLTILLVSSISVLYLKYSRKEIIN